MGEVRGKGASLLRREKEHAGFSVLRGVLSPFQRQGFQGRITVEYSSAFQMCPLKVVVSTDWLAPGQLVLAMSGMALPCLALLVFRTWS